MSDPVFVGSDVNLFRGPFPRSQRFKTVRTEGPVTAICSLAFFHSALL